MHFPLAAFAIIAASAFAQPAKTPDEAVLVEQWTKQAEVKGEGPEFSFRAYAIDRLANHYWARGDYEKAMVYLARHEWPWGLCGVGMEEAEAGIDYRIARCLIRLGRTDEAIADFTCCWMRLSLSSCSAMMSSVTSRRPPASPAATRAIERGLKIFGCLRIASLIVVPPTTSVCMSLIAAERVGFSTWAFNVASVSTMGRPARTRVASCRLAIAISCSLTFFRWRLACWLRSALSEPFL